MSDTVSAAPAADVAIEPVVSAPAVVDTPVVSSVPVDASAPIIGLGTAEDPIIVPAGTQEALKALHDGGLRDADVSQYLETIPEGLRDHIKSLLAGTTELEFREGDPVDPQPAPEPGAFTPLTEEELAKADPKLVEYHNALLRVAEEATADRELPPEINAFMQDPRFQMLVDNIQKGGTEIPAPSDLYDFDSLNADVARLIGEGKNDEAIALVNEVNKLYAKDAIAARDNQWAEFYKQKANEQQEAFAFEQRKTYLKSSFEKAVDMIPEFKAGGALFGQNGEFNTNHPAAEYVAWLQSEEEAGHITDKALIDKGAHFLYDAWKAEKAGSRGAVVAQDRQSFAKQFLDQMKRGKGAALAPYMAQTVGANSTPSQQSVQLHGVNIDALAKDGPDAIAYGRKVADALSNEPAKLKEVLAAVNRAKGIA